MSFRIATVAFAVGLAGVPAYAATIVEHQTFAIDQQGAARDFAAAFWGARRTIDEDFETATLDDFMSGGENVGQIVSPVGVFTGLGGTGTGGSVVDVPTSIQIREVSQFGRQNILPEEGARYLDSNDTLGFTLEIDTGFLGISPVKSLSFFLMDAADQGATFELSYGDDVLKSLVGQADGTINFFAIRFDTPATMATLRFSNTVRLDDGFGVDGFQVAPIPIPPAVAMLLTGLAGLGFIGRRRRNAA